MLVCLLSIKPLDRDIPRKTINELMINDCIMALWLMFKGEGGFFENKFLRPRKFVSQKLSFRAHYVETGEAKDGVTAVYFFKSL